MQVVLARRQTRPSDPTGPASNASGRACWPTQDGRASTVVHWKMFLEHLKCSSTYNRQTAIGMEAEWPRVPFIQTM